MIIFLRLSSVFLVNSGSNGAGITKKNPTIFSNYQFVTNFMWCSIPFVVLCVVIVVNNVASPNIQFKALKIPEPVDTYTKAVNLQEEKAVSLRNSTFAFWIHFSITWYNIILLFNNRTKVLWSTSNYLKRALPNMRKRWNRISCFITECKI